MRDLAPPPGSEQDRKEHLPKTGGGKPRLVLRLAGAEFVADQLPVAEALD